MFPLGTVLLPGRGDAAPRVRAAVSPDGARPARRRRQRSRVRRGDDRTWARGRWRRRTRHGRNPGADRRHRRLARRPLRAGRGRCRALPRQRPGCPDDPYPLADIDVWPDEPSTTSIRPTCERHDRRAASTRASDLNAEVRALGEMAPPPDTEISDDPAIAALPPRIAGAARRRPTGSECSKRRPSRTGSAVFSTALDDAEAVVRFRSS